MATTELLIYGAGGHAKVIIEAWLASGGTVKAIFDDDVARTEILSFAVEGKYNITLHRGVQMVIAVGNSRIRKELAESATHSFGVVRHPSVIVSPSATIGEGTVIFAGAIISSASYIGRHVILNHRCSVDHDCVVADYAHVAPGVTICGEVAIEEGVLVGAGATILPGVRIGRWATVGAGCVVAHDVPEYAVVAGVPGKVLKYIEPGQS
jgi:sugar O-acyltransferase (sialic acid O-acetyltransferase NeuD family)